MLRHVRSSFRPHPAHPKHPCRVERPIDVSRVRGVCGGGVCVCGVCVSCGRVRVRYSVKVHAGDFNDITGQLAAALGAVGVHSLAVVAVAGV